MCRVCARCGSKIKSKDLVKNGKTTDGMAKYKTICKECDNRRRREQIKNQKELWLDVFEDEGIDIKCQKCGFGNRDYFVALDFHHLDPQKKTMNVSDVLYKMAVTHPNAKIVLNEIKNECVLLCSNCHRLIHANIITLEG